LTPGDHYQASELNLGSLSFHPGAWFTYLAQSWSGRSHSFARPLHSAFSLPVKAVRSW
jgi:hypothetical protein